jgi:hypothetical protein
MLYNQPAHVSFPSMLNGKQHHDQDPDFNSGCRNLKVEVSPSGNKKTALLVVLVETARLRWSVAAIGQDGSLMTLLRSETGDLEEYRRFAFDDQIAFLRHRFCGVLQRGCDRIWTRSARASQFVFVFDQPLPDQTGMLTQALASHLAHWMNNPPVVVYRKSQLADQLEDPKLEKIAGHIDLPHEALLLGRFRELLAAVSSSDAWELVPRKHTSHPLH